MENKNTIIAIAVAALVSSMCTTAALKFSTSSGSVDAQTLSSINAEIEQLKSKLILETQARTSLEQQLASSQTTSVKPLTSQPLNSDANLLVTAATLSDTESRQQDIQRLREQRRADRLARQQPGYRQQQLVSAGFAQEEAARIVQIESKESLRQLQTQYDLRRERAASIDNSNPIRAELGDQYYERYLEANGRPTSAQIGSVIGGSPGENAGLRAGDNIISYAGSRIFNAGDLNNLTIQGDIGESVLIEVERDGDSVQLTIPRGPIGVRQGRGRFRR